MNLAASPTALGLTCRQQTGFIGALQTLSTDEVYEMHCLLEVLQANKEGNLLTEGYQGEDGGDVLGRRMETKQNIKYE